MNDSELCQAIVDVCQRLYEQGLLYAADGNVSCRSGEKEVIMTPSGVAKAKLAPEDMARVDLEGNVLEGKPSSEKWLHLEVYNSCPKAKCVIHAHPPTAVAWSIAKPDLEELPSKCLSEVILATGSIPFVPYARPGTEEMGENINPFLPDRRALILSRHGALTWGESFDEAYNGMERIESAAVMLKLAHDLGGLTFLPEEDVNALRELRKKIGEKLL